MSGGGLAKSDDPPGDYFPHDLYKYRRYVLDWCCDPLDQPRFAETPPGGMSLGGEVFPNGWQYVANHPPLYYVLMTPIYAVSDSMSLETQQYVPASRRDTDRHAHRLADVPDGQTSLSARIVLMDGRADIRGLSDTGLI